MKIVIRNKATKEMTLIEIVEDSIDDESTIDRIKRVLGYDFIVERQVFYHTAD